MSTPTKEDAVNRIDPFSPAKTGIDTSGNPVALGDIDSDGYFVGHITTAGLQELWPVEPSPVPPPEPAPPLPIPPPGRTRSRFKAFEGNIEAITDIKIDLVNHPPHLLKLIDQLVEFERQRHPLQIVQTESKPLHRVALVFYSVKLLA